MEKQYFIVIKIFFAKSFRLMAACGEYHTITLSNDGTLYSFGYNGNGALGLGHYHNVSLPTPILNLPKINMISCGDYFTVCVDEEGFIWSFGENKYGQLGTGNTDFNNVPQIIEDIPPVLFVSCGSDHILIITNDSNLWSCGNNTHGQLCLGNKENQMKPQKTSFSNISKISAGSHHSLFQNNKGEIFSCGNNRYGQCGLGHFNHPQITPSLILNPLSNIVRFVCGFSQNLFLDSEGNVYSVGNNYYGELGLGHNTNQNELKKIPNIPPMGWQLGHGGHGDIININTPKIVNTLSKDIQQISCGCTGNHFIAKNSQNQIFGTGSNYYGSLGTGDTQSVLTPKEINSQYSAIWRDLYHSRAKSAMK